MCQEEQDCNLQCCTSWQQFKGQDWEDFVGFSSHGAMSDQTCDPHEYFPHETRPLAAPLSESGNLHTCHRSQLMERFEAALTIPHTHPTGGRCNRRRWFSPEECPTATDSIVHLKHSLQRQQEISFLTYSYTAPNIRRSTDGVFRVAGG